MKEKRVHRNHQHHGPEVDVIVTSFARRRSAAEICRELMPALRSCAAICASCRSR
jgi:H2-forming N5,N10-methylenetetrahydromethanopterin dehydrogenase-like enzyme